MAAPDRDRLAALLDTARRRGADAADVLAISSESRVAAVRLGDIEKLESEESTELGLRVFQGQRAAIASTSDLTDEGLETMLARALAMVATVPEDPYLGLAAARDLARELVAMDSEDPTIPAPEALLDQAQRCEAAARAPAGITNSEGAEAAWGRSRVDLVTSTGFAGGYTVTRSTLSASVLAGEGTAMEGDYDYDSKVYGADLKAPEEIGAEAARRTLARLNPRKVPTAKVPVVYEPRVAASLMRTLAAGINGASIARKSSFLTEKMGAPLFAPTIQITDDPAIPRGLRSRAFDAEGLAPSRRAFIENGVLTSWVLDLRSARQLGLSSTGHASRGTTGHPSPSVSNLYLAPGELSPEALIRDIEAGLLVTDTMGSSTNLVTGDYGVGAAGFWIEKGEIAYPVSELTIAGHLLEMFQSLTPANDLLHRTGVDSPTIRVEGLTVAGQ